MMAARGGGQGRGGRGGGRQVAVPALQMWAAAERAATSSAVSVFEEADVDPEFVEAVSAPSVSSSASSASDSTSKATSSADSDSEVDGEDVCRGDVDSGAGGGEHGVERGVEGGKNGRTALPNKRQHESLRTSASSAESSTISSSLSTSASGGGRSAKGAKDWMRLEVIEHPDAPTRYRVRGRYVAAEVGEKLLAEKAAATRKSGERVQDGAGVVQTAAIESQAGREVAVAGADGGAVVDGGDEVVGDWGGEGSVIGGVWSVMRSVLARKKGVATVGGRTDGREFRME